MSYAAIGVTNPYNSSCNFAFIKIEMETEVWTSSSGKTREEAVSATVTYDLNAKDATYFSTAYMAKDCLDTLLALDKEGKVTRLSQRWGSGAATPLLTELGIYEIIDQFVDPNLLK